MSRPELWNRLAIWRVLEMVIESKNADNLNTEDTHVETKGEKSAFSVGTIGFLVVLAIVVSILAYMSSPLSQKDQRNQQPDPQVRNFQVGIRTA
jgi:hypothetical protein